MGGSRIRRDGRWEDEDKDAEEEEEWQFFIIFFEPPPLSLIAPKTTDAVLFGLHPVG